MGARYRYASLTKMLTAQAVLDAMEQASLPLETPLSHFITAVNGAKDRRWSQVTVERLLTHSAGFDRLHSPDPMTLHAVTPWCPGNLDRLKAVMLDFDPGSGYGYSNLTYCLLGVVLESLSGKSYRAVMQDHFDLAAYGIQFVDGPYLHDEVQYDFRHAGFYTDDYYRYLDFSALSSSAGLSGSALGLARLLADLSSKKRLALAREFPSGSCDPAAKMSCYGNAMFFYQKPDSALSVWVQQGYVFGTSALALLDDRGGLLIWLGNGAPARGSGADIMLDDIYARLAELYEQ
ncbi:serine hydrolase domain-containing protein [Isoalcanivorax beigongshangi]|uniref:Serine hydrolase domain-containing protein n=1 Tax=Isoalcanivorax beigongshangi TaxID=3238810 RepID=A0ABV4AIQ8_9GAMM